MASYSKILIQAVFAVKYRQALIEEAWENELYAIMRNIINGSGCRAIAVNGVSDHVHLFFQLHPTVAIADLMRDIKANSSAWVNKSGKLKNRFAWQEGYSAFSYSASHKGVVERYVRNQKEHHREKSLREEQVALLKRFNIDYQDDCLFRDPV